MDEISPRPDPASTLERIRRLNPSRRILGLDDPEFGRYGRTLSIDVSGLARLADSTTDIDPESNRYVASCPDLENHAQAESFGRYFGFSDLQVGYCNGPNSRLNAVEWHKSAEIDVAVTDLALILGARSDVDDFGRVDSGALRIFFLPAGTTIELFPETLHFSPCKVHPAGFKSLIVLPRGTNEALPAEWQPAGGKTAGVCETPVSETRFLFMKNKWLIAHPERQPLVQRGAYPGIRGENIEILV